MDDYFDVDNMLEEEEEMMMMAQSQDMSQFEPPDEEEFGQESHKGGRFAAASHDVVQLHNDGFQAKDYSNTEPETMGGEESDEELLEPTVERVSGRERSQNLVERLKARQRLRHLAESSTGGRATLDDMSRYLLKRPCPINIDGDMVLTLPNGSMRYLLVDPDLDPFNAKSIEKQRLAVRHSNLDSETCVLERPISQLLQELEDRNFEKQLEAERSQEEERASPAARFIAPQLDKATLLVDKYAPRRFVDLVSNERTNRDVMRWLTSWKGFVFGRNREEWPETRVIMLCGPPGAGKTTLAHVACRHLGYNPVEVNASDERTAPVLTERIRNAMEMSSVFGNSKPNCIILDEFEGVLSQGEGRGPVAALVDMAKAPLKTKTNKSSGGKDENTNTAQPRPKATPPPLTRPVILICNDPYVPALRPIRRMAQMVFFNAAPKNRVVQRLKEICSSERIEPAYGALDVLCEQMDGDIRSCLHALEFAVKASSPQKMASAKAPRKLTLEQVKQVCSAQRDQATDLLRTWRWFFEGPSRRTKRKKQLFRDSTENGGSGSQILARHLSEFPKLLEGLHENMLNLKLLDSSMENLLGTLELMGDMDIVSQKVRTSGAWELNAYQPERAVELRSRLEAEGRLRLSFPEAHSRTSRKRQESRETIGALCDSWIQGGLGSERAMVLDLVSPLMDIVSPIVRSVPWNLLNPSEKDQIESAASIMAKMGIRLIQVEEDPSKELFGQSFHKKVHRPWPRMDRLVQFGEHHPYDSGRHTMPSYSSCEVLSHRAKLAGIRVHHHHSANGNKATESVPTPKRVGKRSAILGATKADHKKKKKAPSVPIPTDFFGRPLPAKVARVEESPTTPTEAISETAQAEDGLPAQKDSSKTSKLKRPRRWIVYQFNEGLTNAVRRPVFMDDLVTVAP